MNFPWVWVLQYGKKQGKETLYAIRIFPIGGYVQMEGEDENSEDKRSFNNAHVLKKDCRCFSGGNDEFYFGSCADGDYHGLPASGSIGGSWEVTSDQSVFQQGDKLLSVNGHGVVSAADFRFQIQRVAADEPLNVTVSGTAKDGIKRCYF